MGHVGDVGDIADMPIGRNAIIVEDVEDKTLPRCQADIYFRMELSLHCILSSRVANYKNDIQ